MHRRSSEQDDYLLRLIREAGEALRRISQRLTAKASAPAVLREEAATAVRALLGSQSAVVSAVDAATAVRLVGDADRIAC